MKHRNSCELCGSTKNLQIHHLLSQTKLNKLLYPEYIHDILNTAVLCINCHTTKPLPKLTEIEFCQLFNIEPRSKTGKMRR